MWLCVMIHSQPQTNAAYLIAGTKSPVTNLTHEPIGLIMLITLWLTSYYIYIYIFILPQ
jgi:hypothetical protein